MEDGLSEDARLQKRVDRLNLERVPIRGDGNCQVWFQGLCEAFEGSGLALAMQ